ncbi:class I SAM-dependent methyltransferase [Nonomuraea sp. NPDC052129]|uniref:SAM-dependent methyltransferase n=1 Tax=Nonomuraea sp. NPDC052129 TaxID=3154651 RepID=UPI00342F0ED0
MPSHEEIIEYYRWKQAEYLGKYGVNGRVHAHVGCHDSETEQNLFVPGWIRPEIGADRLRATMHDGQERNVHVLLRRARRWHGNISKALDCGAGLGGTSFLLADQYGIDVTSLTIVPEQVDFIAAQTAKLALQGKVVPVVGDAHSDTWWNGTAYDLVIALDAVCQIGDPATLFPSLAAMQPAGGVLAIADHFVSSCNSSIARYYNTYWVSAIGDLRTCLSAIEQAGYRIRLVVDASESQLPYWKLSLAYSSLAEKDRTEIRRRETAHFHSAMLSAYRAGEVQYFHVIASRSKTAAPPKR